MSGLQSTRSLSFHRKSRGLPDVRGIPVDMMGPTSGLLRGHGGSKHQHESRMATRHIGPPTGTGSAGFQLKVL